MSTTNQVPSMIAEIIERKRQFLLEERRQKEEAEKREHEEAEAIGRAKYDEYIQASLLKVPEYLRQYVLPTDETPDFYRIGKGRDTPHDWLYFKVPGLAKILFAPNAKGDSWKYQTASPYEQRYDYDRNPVHVEPSLSFSERQWGWTDDLDYALGCAHAELQKYERYVAEYAVKQVEIAAEEAKAREVIERREAADKARKEEQELAEQKKQADLDILFDVLKNDAVAMYLVKAYLLIQEERFNFEQRVEGMDQAMYSMENRWSRRAEELRRQADEAERRAEDEKYRLQSDLDDAEAKLKKVERGW